MMHHQSQARMSHLEKRMTHQNRHMKGSIAKIGALEGELSTLRTRLVDQSSQIDSLQAEIDHTNRILRDVMEEVLVLSIKWQSNT